MAIDQGINYILSLKDLFTGKMNLAENSVSKMDSKMNALKNRSTQLSSALVGVFSATAIIGFGKAVVDSLTNYEYFSASLRTLLHGDKNAANLLQGQLVELSKVSPFSLRDVQDSSKKLLAYGFAAKDIVTQMRMLGDVSSATGNQIGDVAYLYGTLRTQGVAMTKDLREFTNRGINLIPLLAKQFGILEKDVYSFASQGKIGFKDVERAFITMTSKGGDFFNMMNEQSKTVGGKISNLGDSWEQLKITIGKSQTGILNTTITWVTQMVNSLNNLWQNEEKVSASFNKYGAQDYSKMSKFNRALGYLIPGMGANSFTEGMGGNTKYQDGLNKQFVNPSTEGISQALNSQKSLTSIIANLYKDKEARKDITQFNRTIAILKGSLDEVQKNISVFKTQGTEKKLGNDNAKMTDLESGKSELSQGAEISGNKPQSIVITINKLIETQNINTTNLKEGVGKIREMVTKVLLESVNDVNQVANG